jgi:hypothetical protein
LQGPPPKTAGPVAVGIWFLVGVAQKVVNQLQLLGVVRTFEQFDELLGTDRRLEREPFLWQVLAEKVVKQRLAATGELYHETLGIELKVNLRLVRKHDIHLHRPFWAAPSGEKQRICTVDSIISPVSFISFAKEPIRILNQPLP